MQRAGQRAGKYLNADPPCRAGGCGGVRLCLRPGPVYASSVRSVASGPAGTPLALHWAQEYRESMLEIALRVLRLGHPDLAGMMAEVLEMSVRGDSWVPDQVARILAAVRLATLPNQAIWLAT